MHGPYIVHEGRKRKVFLIGAIDDCSRVIVGARFFFHENSFNLEAVLKEAMIRFGTVKMLYTDNGTPLFISSHLQLACARLGIALVHSKPYDSPSRGKIERFFRTVREKFLSCLDLKEIDSIEDLNISFSRWLDKEYHKSHHSGINARPLDKWMDDMKNITIKRISAKELDLAFYVTIKRRVKNDSTISAKPSSFVTLRINRMN
jgi:transposase InsO family protein